MSVQSYNNKYNNKPITTLLIILLPLGYNPPATAQRRPQRALFCRRRRGKGINIGSNFRVEQI